MENEREVGGKLVEKDSKIIVENKRMERFRCKNRDTKRYNKIQCLPERKKHRAENSSVQRRLGIRVC